METGCKGKTGSVPVKCGDVQAMTTCPSLPPSLLDNLLESNAPKALVSHVMDRTFYSILLYDTIP